MSLTGLSRELPSVRSPLWILVVMPCRSHPSQTCYKKRYPHEWGLRGRCSIRYTETPCKMASPHVGNPAGRAAPPWTPRAILPWRVGPKVHPGTGILHVCHAAPLAFFGAATGFMAGVYLNRAERLHQLLLEQEQSTAPFEAVKALSAMPSHHLLNANMIIGSD